MPSSSRARLGLLLLVVAVPLAYASALQGGWVWDDDSYVTENATLRADDALRRIWLEPEASPQYYPVVFTVLWAEHALWGTDPAGYHLLNVLLHTLNAVLVFLLCRRLEIPGALLAALVFGLHPVHVESVAWVTELKNVLSGSFYLLAFLAWLHVEQKGWLAWAASFAAYVLALLSKTVTASLPVAFLLVRWWKRGAVTARDVVPLLPFFAVGAALGLHTARLEKEQVGAVGFEWSLTFLERVWIAGRALWFYVGKLLWPAELVFSYPRWTVDTGVFWQALFPLAALALTLLLWALRHRIGRGPLAAALFFAASLFPALGFFDVYPMRYSFVADHFQYLASLGPIVLLSALAAHGLERASPGLRRVGVGACAVVLLALGLLTFLQGRLYADVETIMSDVIEKNPTSWMAHLKRGNEYTRRQDFERALADYDRSLEIQPRQLGSWINRGYIHVLEGRLDRALADFEQAALHNPGSEEPDLNIGVVHMRRGRFEQALEHVDRAARANPENVQALLYRGMLLAGFRRFDEALRDYDAALRLAPENARLYEQRARALAGMGRLDESAADARRARALGAAPDARQSGG